MRVSCGCPVLVLTTEWPMRTPCSRHMPRAHPQKLSGLSSDPVETQQGQPPASKNRTGRGSWCGAAVTSKITIPSASATTLPTNATRTHPWSYTPRVRREEAGPRTRRTEPRAALQGWTPGPGSSSAPKGGHPSLPCLQSEELAMHEAKGTQGTPRSPQEIAPCPASVSSPGLDTQLRQREDQVLFHAAMIWIWFVTSKTHVEI